MDQVMVSLVTQSPTAAALIVVVVLMLRHIERNNDDWRETLKGVHAEASEARALARKVIEDNTRAVAENTRAMDEIRDLSAELLTQLKDHPPKSQA